MTDRRLTPANGRVAHVSLRDEVAAERYVEGEPFRVRIPVADLRPAPDRPRDRQLLFGEEFLVLDHADGHVFGQAEKDGYVGWVAAGALAPRRGPATHRVSAAATHVYLRPDIKTEEAALLSIGSRLEVIATHPGFIETAEGWFLPQQHVAPVGVPESDPVTVAARLLGAPYLWGGNSYLGIDCSGLVQLSLTACGIACPGDSDLQRERVGEEIAQGTALRRGDLLFWTGHVAMVVDAERLIHATGHAMTVVHEGIAAAQARILTSEGLPVRTIRRPARGG